MQACALHCVAKLPSLKRLQSCAHNDVQIRHATLALSSSLVHFLLAALPASSMPSGFASATWSSSRVLFSSSRLLCDS